MGQKVELASVVFQWKSSNRMGRVCGWSHGGKRITVKMDDGGHKITTDYNNLITFAREQ